MAQSMRPLRRLADKPIPPLPRAFTELPKADNHRGPADRGGQERRSVSPPSAHRAQHR
jgi:hypothetical protein